MPDSILGTRIREHRRRSGITQSKLAQKIGISASYLNLIEGNKRRITPALLDKVANALSVQIEELDGASERRLVETLTEIAHLPALSGLAIEAEGAGELIGRYPGWARALASLVRSERDANRTARSLADRLTHDPFLSETVHGMLGRVAAIRSAVEILTEFDDIDTDQHDRFMAIIQDETAALTEIGEALATYFEKSEAAEATLTPVDEVEALFEAKANRFDTLEDLATEFATLVDLRSSLPPLVAAHAVAAEHLTKPIKRMTDAESILETTVGRDRAQRHLSDYATRALLLPMESFLRDCLETRFDIEALSKRTGLEMQILFQRLTALPDHHSDAEGSRLPRIGYFLANASGTIKQMLGLPGLALPRYASACPLWVLYRAQQMPETMMRQRVVFPNGDRFVFVARARRVGAISFNQPRHYVTDMIAMREEDAAMTVYAPDAATLVEEVGPACRLCPRRACEHRADDPLAG